MSLFDCPSADSRRTPSSFPDSPYSAPGSFRPPRADEKYVPSTAPRTSAGRSRGVQRLQHVRARAAAERSVDPRRVVDRREDHDAQPRMALGEQVEADEAIHPGHHQVEQENVGSEPLDERERFVPAAALPDDLEVVYRLQRGSGPRPSSERGRPQSQLSVAACRTLRSVAAWTSENPRPRRTVLGVPAVGIPRMSELVPTPASRPRHARRARARRRTPAAQLLRRLVPLRPGCQLDAKSPRTTLSTRSRPGCSRWRRAGAASGSGPGRIRHVAVERIDVARVLWLNARGRCSSSTRSAPRIRTSTAGACPRTP